MQYEISIYITNSSITFFSRQKVDYVLLQGLIYLCTEFHQNRLNSFRVNRIQAVEAKDLMVL